jgi:DNA polymerase III subunit chi
MLAEKTLEAGGRLLVVADAQQALDRLDAALWTYRADSFLPHGKAGGEGEGDQPVLLADSTEATNGASNVALADGKWRDSALSFDRAFFLFTPELIDDARDAWRALADKDCVERHYWKQDEAGKWREGP